MRTSDLPISVWLREADSNDLPNELAGVSSAVRRNVVSSVRADSFLSDVFSVSGNGMAINPDSKVLSWHFDGMPIVPGVASKRLVAAFLQSDLYGSAKFPNGRKTFWKTEFITPMSCGSHVEFRLTDGSYELADGKKTFVKFTYGEEETHESRTPHNFWATNVKDVYHGLANAVPKDDADKFVLQSAPFRFVTTGGELSHQPGIDRAVFLWGYFEVPKDFAFVDAYGQVHNEIIEESVAQIASFAYSKSRRLPTVRTENGSFDPKAQVLTFKSSIAEAGIAKLISGDRLTVAIDIVEEEGRTVKFAYEAWNSSHACVLKGMIEGSAVPLKLLKRMIG